MEYSIDKLDEAIVFYLTCNPDKPKSIYEVYNGLCEEKICPDLNKSFMTKDINKTKFTTICHVLDTLYCNIHKFYSNNTLYLMFSLKDKNQIILSNYHLIKNVTNPVCEFLAPDQCNVINYMLDNKNYCTSFNLTEFMNDRDTMLHIVCQSNRVDLLDKMLLSYDVDINVKNKEGKTPLDISTNNQIMRKLLEYDFNRKLLKLQVDKQDLKENNTHIINTTSLSLNKCSEDMQKLKNQMYMYKFLFFATGIGMFLNSVLF